MRRRLILILAGAMLIAAVGCEEPKITPEQASPFVEQWAGQVGPAIKEQASSAAASESLKRSLLAAREADRKKLQRDEPPYGKLAEQVYAAREYKPAFIHNGELTPAGKELLEALERVDRDGFDPKPYQMPRVREKLAQLEKLRAEFEELGEFSPGRAERDFVLSHVTTKTASEFALDDTSFEQVNDALMDSPAGADLREQLERYDELSAKMADLQAEVDQKLAVGLMRYARELKHFRLPEIFVHPRHDDYYNDYEIRERRPLEAKAAYKAGYRWRHAVFTAQAIAKAKGPGLLHDKLRGVLEQAIGAESVKPILAKLSPGPQYDALREEYVRYREIVAAGGWDKVPSQRRLRRGQKSEAVKKLKKRLQLEGYFPKDKAPTTLFDEDLTDAIKAYQATHQMAANGRPDRSFWRSVNVPAKARLEQIELNMKRWRESNVQHHEHDVYVVVNIPDFHAEIWKDQKLAKRMRVVVGNNDTEEDEETGDIEHPNRTPKVSAYIDRVIYNPYWNVTPRIREEETLVDVRKDLEQRYQAKVDRLLGATAQGAAASPAALQGSTSVADLLDKGDGENAQPAAAPAPKVYSKTEEGWKLDIAAFKAAYKARRNEEADVAALFPYVVPETGLVDVSTTDPDNIPPWYAENGYEVMHPGKSWEYVRQLNGDENSLGRVKVIFPNLHDVYLHDTPHKALFRREIRAFSHGCMRMHEPLDFAAWLLENDGQYDAKRVKKLLAETTYMPIFLKRRVPVHVEYFTVRADAEGRANFLIDIYDYDES